MDEGYVALVGMAREAEYPNVSPLAFTEPEDISVESLDGFHQFGVDVVDLYCL